MIVATVAEALEGLDGWFRWGAWAAHFFVNGVQSCNTVHSHAAGGMARGLPPARPQPADLSRHGRPFGRVCARCLKLSRATAPLVVETRRVCGDVAMFAAVVLCRCGKYRQHNRPHRFSVKRSNDKR